MHEQSLMKDFMQKITDIAEKEQAEKITRVAVQLGALSHFSPDHFREHFNTAAKGTIAEGATIEVVLSEDIHDPHAQDVRLMHVEINSAST